MKVKAKIESIVNITDGQVASLPGVSRKGKNLSTTVCNKILHMQYDVCIVDCCQLHFPVTFSADR